MRKKNLKQNMLKTSMKWHRWLGWTGGIALLIFALSGITHPLMSWFGPQAAAFFPPQTEVKGKEITKIADILAKHEIQTAVAVKLVPSQQGAVLQITQDNYQPRRYFDLATLEELIDFDSQQAEWLARYYSGLKSGPKQIPIKHISLQTEFDSAYTWVNRLLPVYRVEFDTEDQLTTYIYTELGVLAGLTNQWKTNVQRVFRWLHTWSWLNNFENARIIIMLILLISLFGMAATGTALVFLLKRRKIKSFSRYWHQLIAYLVWLPLLMFTIRGCYHLLKFSYGENHRGLVLNQPISLANFSQLPKLTPEIMDGISTPLNSLSLVEGPDGELFYRLSQPNGQPGQKIGRNEKYSGTLFEKSVLYIHTETGLPADITDETLAIYFAKKHLARKYSDRKNSPKDEGINETQEEYAPKVINTELVTRFGPSYDFRNKRLPVWLIEFDTELGDQLFIDPATSFLVDHSVKQDRYESYSFSFLHKWNFLLPLTSRQTRDIIIVIILSLAIVFTLLGYSILLRRNKKK